MKRIYLLVFLFVALATNAFAQRSVNMSMNHYFVTNPSTGTIVIMKDGDKILANAGPNGPQLQYMFRLIFKCNGPDTLVKSDKINYKFALNQNAVAANLWGTNGMGLGDSAWITTQAYTLTPNSSVTKSGVVSTKWCDSMWVTDTASALVADPDKNNNVKCNNINIEYWLTDIESALIDPNVLALYPNPTTYKLTLKYNFTQPSKTATATIMDATGKVVHVQNLGTNLSGTKDMPIEVSHLGSGVYFVHLQTSEGQSASSKFVMQ